MKEFRDFKSAREFVRSLGLKNQKEWTAYCKSGNKPDDIPAGPREHYKKEWKGIGNWLGTGTQSDKYKKSRSFIDARAFVQKLELKTSRTWKEYCKSGKKPDNIPSNPNATYKKEWKGYGDWLGTGTIATKDKKYRPYKEAREFVRSLGLKTGEEWTEYCKSGNKPDDIPSSPWDVYKEWKKK